MVSSDITYVTVYDAPYELPDPAIKYRLRHFGSIVSSRRSKVLGFSAVPNGLQVYGMNLSESVPSFLLFGHYLLRVWHPQQVPTCQKCNRPGHIIKTCPNTICFNCEELGDTSHDCSEPVVCCICRDIGHYAIDCRYSWHRRPVSARDADVPPSDPVSCVEPRDGANSRDAVASHNHPPDHPRNHPRDPPRDDAESSPSSSGDLSTASSAPVILLLRILQIL